MEQEHCARNLENRDFDIWSFMVIDAMIPNARVVDFTILPSV